MTIRFSSQIAGTTNSGKFVCDSEPSSRCSCCSPQVEAFNRRIRSSLSRREALGGFAALLATLGLKPAKAQPSALGRAVLLSNLRLFDGLSTNIRQDVNVLVRENRFAGLPPSGEKLDGVETIDCGGRLAMPGLIDAHWHTMMCGLADADMSTAGLPYVHLVAAREAERTLLRGFTTVRDAGGPSFAIKRAIDQGVIDGPRIFPSGAMISQTSGHGDYRQRNEVPRDSQRLSFRETAGFGIVADGESEVLRRVREQLLLGATQIKMAAGGGVFSSFDPIDVTQYTERELRAGVEAAEDWGTYVMTHVYTPRGIQRAVRAGVKSIEHGQLADEESARMMAGEGIWWSLQPFFRDGDVTTPKLDAARLEKALRVAKGTERAYDLAKRFKINTAWGTDILFAPQSLARHARQLTKLSPGVYEPLDLLRIATARNGELLRLSGPRNQYGGDVGVIAPGALADLLIADGDPTKSLEFLADPDKTLRLVMKDGRIYKNTLSSR
ncbi:amidohydrolase family protein [Bradyrhizobium sp. 14AA]